MGSFLLGFALIFIYSSIVATDKFISWSADYDCRILSEKKKKIEGSREERVRVWNWVYHNREGGADIFLD